MNTGFSIRKPTHNKTLGIEIECFSEPYLLRTGEYKGFFYITNDWSIANPFGTLSYEFVSQPLPCEWLKKEIQKLWKFQKWESNTSCGVHVHVSRKWLSAKKAAAIYKFVCSLKENEFNDLFGREPNEYCRQTKEDTRYRAVNTQPTQTIEFRMFKSGSAQWCQYCLDMVVYMIENAYHLNIDAALAFRDLSFRKYNL